jgi:hypothetical protein
LNYFEALLWYKVVVFLEIKISESVVSSP